MRSRFGRVFPVALSGFAASAVLVTSVTWSVDELLPGAAASPAGAATVAALAAGTTATPDGLRVTVDAVYPDGHTESWSEHAEHAEPAEATALKAKKTSKSSWSTNKTAGKATKSTALAATASRAQCRDSAYTLAGWRVNGNLRWYYNASGAPSTVSRTALTSIRAAAQTLVGAQNQCGLRAPFKVAQQYRGATKLVPAVTATSKSTSCGKNDNYSAVGWKRMTTTALAVTCTWWTSDRKVVSADIAINSRYRWFTSKPARCSSTFDLRSVLTHEWGHAYGLNHVSPTTHGTQVMASTIKACASLNTLGAGDYTAMRKLYGVR
ncbi:matrixin family metalloprotease [Planobispora takensis]|uniref:Peptidase M10 metallopeptidase domain-containing protein n=1 Tax=Planobispora takensis TaxID=1367882 RepID=A0A8J3WXH6_9ACTN|nr:matrixin family metalloprotease [Planobispora takensis]GII06054.1 hypothetical protein Pta02_80620 [Planobispora takensis]